jgi:hypothetical protein
MTVSLSEFELKRIGKIFPEYCEKRVPAHLSSEIKIEYQIRGDELTLYESRPVWDDHAKWISGKVARFKKDPQTETWYLYWADANGRWIEYSLLPCHRDIAKLLAEVEKNGNGAFWG